MPFHGIFALALLILIIFGVIALARSLWAGPAHAVRWQQYPSPGIEVLEERYAKGEIESDEYLQKKRDLGG